MKCKGCGRKFEILSRDLTRETEENNENPQVKVDDATAMLCHLSRFSQR
jgi:hypothetical protein